MLQLHTGHCSCSVVYFWGFLPSQQLLSIALSEYRQKTPLLQLTGFLKKILLDQGPFFGATDLDFV